MPKLQAPDYYVYFLIFMRLKRLAEIDDEIKKHILSLFLGNTI